MTTSVVGKSVYIEVVYEKNKKTHRTGLANGSASINPTLAKSSRMFRAFGSGFNRQCGRCGFSQQSDNENKNDQFVMRCGISPQSHFSKKFKITKTTLDFSTGQYTMRSLLADIRNFNH